MFRRRLWILGLSLSAASLAALVKVRGFPSALNARAPSYDTSCAIADAAAAVDGYVSNTSPDSYRVAGEVRFSFPVVNATPRPDILVQADGPIPAGQTARIARARLAFPLRPGESCAFDVKNALRKP
ncbi:MAG: hypothetical protein ACHQ49_03065 [Elusimicrobiota bacterium]